MFILDQPFVSPFLIKTIKENQLKVVATPIGKSLVKDNHLPWIAESEAIDLIKKNPRQPVYTNSENGLDWIVQHFPDSTITRHIQMLKDKIQFRELIRSVFPNYYFTRVSIEEIDTLNSQELPFPFVIKPAIGFFSVGVHIVQDENDWYKVKKALTPDKLKSIFPQSVLNTSQFIIEELITGEEYAIDYYHNNEGDVVILNIMHHIFASGTDTSDRVYTTSKRIITEHHLQFREFLTGIGNQLELKNFPAHAEVRINEKGKILPIEINPMRFGGWCTTADLMGVSLGYNPYIYYFQGKTPDWNNIYKGKEDKLYSIVVLDNNSGIRAGEIRHFDYEKLVADFENPLLMRRLDIFKDSVFGFLFTETTYGNEKELFDILTSDLRKYIQSE